MIAIQQHLIKALRKLQNNGSALSLGSSPSTLVTLEDILKHVQQRLNALPMEKNPSKIDSLESLDKSEKQAIMEENSNFGNNTDASLKKVPSVGLLDMSHSKHASVLFQEYALSSAMTPVARPHSCTDSTNLNHAANVDCENGAKTKAEIAFLSRLNSSGTVDKAVLAAAYRPSAHDERKQTKAAVSTDFSSKCFLQESRTSHRTARSLRATNFLHSITLNSAQEAAQSKSRVNSISSMTMSSSTASAAQSHQSQQVPEESPLSSHCTPTLSFISDSNSSTTPTSGSGRCDENVHSANPCFKNSLADIVQFMEIIGNLKVSHFDL